MAHLKDLVCLVTGATRGIGRGIALGLADLGATIYITGRTLNAKNAPTIGGSLEVTANEISARGGKPIPVVVDHSNDNEVKDLFDRIQREQKGRLDILVNNVFSAAPFLMKMLGTPYYEMESCSPAEAWDSVNNVGLRNHYICSTYATRMMLRCREENPEHYSNPGMIVNISSMGGQRYLFNTAYGVGKSALDRMTVDMSIELRKNKADVCIISLWPGIVRTEEIMSTNVKNESLDILLNNLDLSESPELSGLAVAALVKESKAKLMTRSGQILLVCDIAREYGIREADGSIPPDLRSLSTLLRLSGHRAGNYVPNFIRLTQETFMSMLRRA